MQANGWLARDCHRHTPPATKSSVSSGSPMTKVAEVLLTPIERRAKSPLTEAKTGMVTASCHATPEERADHSMR